MAQAKKEAFCFYHCKFSGVAGSRSSVKVIELPFCMWLFSYMFDSLCIARKMSWEFQNFMALLLGKRDIPSPLAITVFGGVQYSVVPLRESAEGETSPPTRNRT